MPINRRTVVLGDGNEQLEPEENWAGIKKGSAASYGRRPSNTPLEQWPDGWLKMEVASLLDVPDFILLYDHEKKKRGYPVTADDMREFIRDRREADALLANPELLDK